jgi:hypothetical protein
LYSVVESLANCSLCPQSINADRLIDEFRYQFEYGPQQGPSNRFNDRQLRQTHLPFVNMIQLRVKFIKGVQATISSSKR